MIDDAVYLSPFFPLSTPIRRLPSSPSPSPPGENFILPHLVFPQPKGRNSPKKKERTPRKKVRAPPRFNLSLLSTLGGATNKVRELYSRTNVPSFFSCLQFAVGLICFLQAVIPASLFPTYGTTCVGVGEGGDFYVLIRLPPLLQKRREKQGLTCESAAAAP